MFILPLHRDLKYVGKSDVEQSIAAKKYFQSTVSKNTLALHYPQLPIHFNICTWHPRTIATIEKINQIATVISMKTV